MKQQIIKLGNVNIKSTKSICCTPANLLKGCALLLPLTTFMAIWIYYPFVKVFSCEKYINSEMTNQWLMYGVRQQDIVGTLANTWVDICIVLVIQVFFIGSSIKILNKKGWFNEILTLTDREIRSY